MVACGDGWRCWELAGEGSMMSKLQQKTEYAAPSPSPTTCPSPTPQLCAGHPPDFCIHSVATPDPASCAGQPPQDLHSCLRTASPVRHNTCCAVCTAHMFKAQVLRRNFSLFNRIPHARIARSAAHDGHSSVIIQRVRFRTPFFSKSCVSFRVCFYLLQPRH